MPENVTVTVAPGRTLSLAWTWTSPDGSDCASEALTLSEGETAELPVPTARVLAAEGVIL